MADNAAVLDVEGHFISAVLKAEDAKGIVTQGITKEMFHINDLEAVWLMQYIQRHGRTPPIQTFQQQFPSFVIYDVDDVPHWAEKVRQDHVRMLLTGAFSEALDDMDADDFDSAMSHVQKVMTQAQVAQQGNAGSFDIFGEVDDVFSVIEARVERAKKLGLAGVPTGFPTLDLAMGGLQPGWLVTVGARLSHGKSWTLLKMAFTAAVHGHKVLFFSLEQSRHQIAARLHAFGARQYGLQVVNGLDIMRGSIPDINAYRDVLIELKQELGNRFVVNDTSRGRVTPMTVASMIESEQPDVVMLDYVQLMGGGGGRMEDWVALAQISGELQAIAQRYETPVVMASQMNRDADGASDPSGPGKLSRSDAIGQDSDAVISLVTKAPNVKAIKLTKFRHGPDQQMLFAEFDPGKGIYDEITGDQAGRLIDAAKDDD